MRTVHVLLLSVAAVAGGQRVHSEVETGDFLSTGDGLLVRDTVANREWLNLTLLKGKESTYLHGHPYLTLHWFTHAARSDVSELWLNAGIPFQTGASGANSPGAQNLVALLGATEGTIGAHGTYADPLGASGARVAWLSIGGAVPSADIIGSPIHSTLGNPIVGHYLMRPSTGADCSDGVDNDRDGLADYPTDPGCDSPTDELERSDAFECDDGRDQDGDTFIDFAPGGGGDAECDCPSDASEAGAPSCLISVDFAVTGDGKLTLDLGSGLEWLDLTVTRGMSPVNVGNSVYVTQHGFSMSDSAGVSELWSDAGIPFQSGSHPSNSPGVQSLIALIGATDGTDAAHGVNVGGNLTGTSVSRLWTNGGNPIASLNNDPIHATVGNSAVGHYLARPTSGPDCSDGVDNDGDGRVDSADAGCSGPTDWLERRNGMECDDGVDNDADGMIDYPADFGCFGPNDSWEGVSSGSCGIGPELLPALGVIALLRRRRRG